MANGYLNQPFKLCLMKLYATKNPPMKKNMSTASNPDYMMRKNG